MSDFLRFIILFTSGWVNRLQNAQIDYLMEENQVLREHIPNRKIRFTHDQRRRLAIKAQAVGRRGLNQIAGIVTPQTLLRWYRTLIARKYDGSAKRGPGRPRTKPDIAGESHLRSVLKEYAAHYHIERNHQGIGNRLISPAPHVGSISGPVKTKRRLGGSPS